MAKKKSTVNKAGNYTKPGMRKRMFNSIMAGSKGGKPGQWRTKSGKPSAQTGERYLPDAAIKKLSAKEYAATTRKKRKDTKKGKQHSKQPKKVAKKTKRYR